MSSTSPLWRYCHVVIPKFGTLCRFVDTDGVERKGEYIRPHGGNHGMFYVDGEHLIGIKWRPLDE